jgi:hypothetical protein
MPRTDESAFRSDAIESTDSPRVAWACGTAAKTFRAKHIPSNNLENFLVFMMVVSPFRNRVQLRVDKTARM